MISTGISSVIRSCQPSLLSPAAARTIASYWPSSSFLNRVSTLPRRCLDLQAASKRVQLSGPAQGTSADASARSS